MSFLTSFLAGIGVAFVLGTLYKLVNLFTKLYFTPPTNWEQYGAKKGGWALVTGSTDGIGKEFALQLAKKGFNLILVARNKEKLQTVKDQIMKEFKNVSVNIIQFDFAESSKFEQLVEALREKKVSILVNNVGVSHDHPEYFDEISHKSIEAIVNVNMLNTLRLTRLVLPGMVEQGMGMVLNIGSFSGEIPIPLLQTYSASKAFLKSWSISLASEVRSKGVSVQLLNTYFVVSNMSKFKRPTMMIPTPKTYVAAALKNAGQSDFATPYAPHALLNMAMGMVPSWILVLINRTQMRRIRQIALERAFAKND